MDLLIFPIKQYNVPNPFRNPYGLPSKNWDKNTGHCLNNGFVSTFGIYDETLIGLWLLLEFFGPFFCTWDKSYIDRIIKTWMLKSVNSPKLLHILGGFLISLCIYLLFLYSKATNDCEGQMWLQYALYQWYVQLVRLC